MAKNASASRMIMGIEKRPTKLLAATTVLVSHGRSPPSPVNSWAKTGITFHRMTQTTMTAMAMIVDG